MTATIAVNEFPATRVVVHVPGVGAWYADVDFADEAAELPTAPFACRIRIDAVTLVGTVEPRRNGTFGLQRRCRIVGGANGWGALVKAKSYHNDAGVRGSLVAQDVAKEVGESLPDAVVIASPMGNDYLRPALERGKPVPAARVLEDACRGVPWRVDYDGVTRVRPRTPPTPEATDYTVIEQDPRHGSITLALDDVSKIGVGTLLTAHLDTPVRVTALEISAAPDGIRMIAWCGGERSALADTMRAIVEQCGAATLDGTYRYRVLGMNVDRVDLQRCGNRKDLPNTVATSMWPGASGVHAKLTRGCEVLVCFIDGDRAQPAIVGFVGKGGPGWLPEELSLCDGNAGIARVGDIVNFFFPPLIPFSGTIAGSPVVGTLTITTPGIGAIQSGAEKAKA